MSARMPWSVMAQHQDRSRCSRLEQQAPRPMARALASERLLHAFRLRDVSSEHCDINTATPTSLMCAHHSRESVCRLWL